MGATLRADRFPVARAATGVGRRDRVPHHPRRRPGPLSRRRGGAGRRGRAWPWPACPTAAAAWRHVVAAGVLVAALGKAAQLPFSFWLSRAMAGPSPVSALLHSAAMVAMGGYLLLRAAAAAGGDRLGASDGRLGGRASPRCCWARSRSPSATSSSCWPPRPAAQLGFVVLAAGCRSVAGGAAHLVAHAATKALLFLAAGAWLTALGTKQLGGAARRGPALAAGRGLRHRRRSGAGRGRAAVAVGDQGRRPRRGAGSVSPRCTLVGLAAAVLSAAYAGEGCWSSCGSPAPAGRPTSRYDTTRSSGTRQRRRRCSRLPLVGARGRARPCSGVLALPPVAGVAARGRSARRRARGRAAAELAVSAAARRWWRCCAVAAGARCPEPGWARRLAGPGGRAARLLVVRPVLRAGRGAGPLRRPGARPRRSTRSRPRRAAAWPGWPPAPTTGGVDGAVEGVAGSGRAGWAASRAGRRPASCTSTTSRPSSCSWPAVAPARRGEVRRAQPDRLPARWPPRWRCCAVPRLPDAAARVGVGGGGGASTSRSSPSLWAGLRHPAAGRLAFEERVAGSPASSSSYHVGVDGLSLPLVAHDRGASSSPARSTRCASGSGRARRRRCSCSCRRVCLGPVRRRRPDPVLRLLRPVHRRHVLRHRRLGPRRRAARVGAEVLPLHLPRVAGAAARVHRALRRRRPAHLRHGRAGRGATRCAGGPVTAGWCSPRSWSGWR